MAPRAVPTDRVVRVLLADDHAMVRTLLKQALGDEPGLQVIAETGSGADAIRLAADLLPDVAVVDISMREPDGVAVTQTITAQCPNVRVVVFTRHTDPAFVRRVFAVGASGYVLKQSPTTELIAAIRTVSGVGTYVDRAMGSGDTGPAGPMGESALVDGGPESLTTAEQRILRSIARGESDRDIARQWRIPVDEVVQRKAEAMRKARLTGRAHVIRFAQAAGWLHDED